MLHKLIYCVIVTVSLVTVESLKFGDRVCTTDDCKIIAKNINQSINTKVEPCDNFYEYACGEWIAENSFSHDDFQPRSHQKMKSETIRSRVKGLLEAESGPNEIKPIKQARKWYKQCMDEKSIEASGVEPIQSILNRIGGWPMAMDRKDWNETKFPWKKVNRYFLRKTGGYYLWNVKALNAQYDDSDGWVILSDPVFPMSEVYRRSATDITSPSWEDYGLLISDVVNIFGESNQVTIDEARLLQETNELISFEMKLQTMALREKSPYSENPWKEIELGSKNISKKFDGSPNSTIDYDRIINDLFDIARVEKPLTIWTDKEFYLESLSEYLQSVPQRIIVNYLHWCFIAEMWWLMNEEMRGTVLYGLPKPLGLIHPYSRESQCVDRLSMNMIHVVSYLYVQQYFMENTEKSAQEMVQNIRSAFTDKIRISQWLGEKPKVSATELINGMNFFIAYPDWYNNASALTKYYKLFRTGSTILDTQLEYMRYRAHMNLEKFLMHSESAYYGFSDKGQTPLTVNAFYAPEINSAILPEPVFEVPSFSEDYPLAVNYGMAGYVVGHEMAHAFTGPGMCSWTKSNLTSLSTSEVETIHDKAACFIYQSDEYYGYPTAEAELLWPCTALDGDDPDGGNQTIGQRTQEENIADTTGLQTAFLAYKKKTKNIYPQLVEKLPDLEHFTDDQLFFLSYANHYCTAISPVYENKKDSHSNRDFRINSAVSNTVEFAEAFNCPKGKPMNPEKKCTIWDQEDIN